MRGEAKKIGFTTMVIVASDTEVSILRNLRILLDKTPPGRHCAIIYDLQNHESVSSDSDWGRVSIWYEPLLLEYILGDASRHNDSISEDPNEWEFFGNLAVRFCEPKQETRHITDEIGVLLFRKKGEKTYKRKTEVCEETKESSTINTLHPVFTRDVANNIWHMKNQESRYNIVDHLGTLLAWSDEEILVSKNSKLKTRKRSKGNFDLDLIGVPKKIQYQNIPELQQQKLL